MKIKSYSQLQAARARLSVIMNNHVLKDGNVDKFSTELKSLTTAIIQVEDSGIESTLKQTHEQIKIKSAKALKPKENPIMKAKQKFENFLTGKSVLLNSGDGSELAIAAMVNVAIAQLTGKSNGLLSQISINPMASVDYSIRRELTSAQIARYEQSDGTIGFSRTDTMSGGIMKNKLNLSDLYHQLPVTDEAMSDVPNLVNFTLTQLHGKYEDQYGAELLLGDSASAELPGVLTDLLDSANGYVEALKADESRDANTFGAVATGSADSLGTDAHAVFNSLVASLPAKLRSGATVTMNPTTLEAYANVKGNDGQPVFDISPTSFEGYPLSLDDNMPVLGDASKAIVAFGNADTAIAMGNVDVKLAQNPIQRDGATLFKHIGRVGLTVKDNLALRLLLAKA
jgi:HK97 family phage major capsid protein